MISSAKNNKTKEASRIEFLQAELERMQELKAMNGKLRREKI